jgi:hypothetical protein
MYQEFYRNSQYLDLPLFALLLFLTVFVATVLWLFVVQRKSKRFERISALPLEEETEVIHDA